MKQILCLDFDGVIHSYTSGWKGPSVISDPPVPGAIQFIKEALGTFRVAILSARSHQEGGKRAMQDALLRWAGDNDSDVSWLREIEWPDEKPPALVTIDDRAIQFTGEWPAVDVLQNFKPWYLGDV